MRATRSDFPRHPVSEILGLAGSALRRQNGVGACPIGRMLGDLHKHFVVQRRRGLQGACLPGESDLQKFLLFMLEIQLLSGDVLAHGPVVCGEIHVILTEIMLFAHLPAVRGNPWGHPPPAHHLMCSEQHLLLHSK